MTSLRDQDETAEEQQVTPEETPPRTAADMMIGSLVDQKQSGWPPLVVIPLIIIFLAAALFLTARWLGVEIAIPLFFIALFALSLPRVFSNKPGALSAYSVAVGLILLWNALMLLSGVWPFILHPRDDPRIWLDDPAGLSFGILWLFTTAWIVLGVPLVRWVRHRRGSGGG